MQMGSYILRNDIFSVCLQLILCFISFLSGTLILANCRTFFGKGNLSFLVTFLGSDLFLNIEI